jgi:hypothetical protein
MRQKTFKVSELSFEPEVGQEVILISHEDYSYGNNKEVFTAVLHTGEGIPGNLGNNIKRYHGWRGTTNNIALYAYGLRKITKVEYVDMGSSYGYKVTVGKDLHPEWD